MVSIRSKLAAADMPHEPSFDQTLAPFGQASRIRDDRRSHAQHRRAPAAFARGQAQGADCHIEGGIASAIGVAASIRPIAPQ